MLIFAVFCFSATKLALGIFPERFKLARTRRVTQLAQRFGFDLPNAFAGDSKMLAHFLERVFRTGSSQTKTHFDNFSFSRGVSVASTSS